MQNRWADQKLKTCEASLLCLEAAWKQYQQATKGINEALADGMAIALLEQTYPLNWEKVWQAIRRNKSWGHKSYQLWKWLQQGEVIQQHLMQIELLIADYRLQIHNSGKKATEFWQGYAEGKVLCRTPCEESPKINGSPTPYQKGVLLGWRYAIVKHEIQTRLYCCRKTTADLFTWG